MLSTKPRLSLAVFSSLPIAWKVGLGFSLVLAILATSGIVGNLSVSQIDANYTAYAQRVEVDRKIMIVGWDFQAYRRNAREFALIGSADAMKSIDSIAPRLKSEITDALSFIKSPERHAKIAEIAAGFDTYSAQIAQLKDLRLKGAKATTEMNALVNGPMKVTAEQINTDLRSISQSAEKDARQFQHELDREIDFTRNVELWLAVAGLSLGVTVAWLIGRAISQPVIGLAQALRDVANGDLDSEIVGLGRTDEIGDMADGLMTLREAARAKIALEEQAEQARRDQEVERAKLEADKNREAADIAEAVKGIGAGLQSLADGDLTCAIAKPFAGQLDLLRADFNATVDRLKTTVANIVEATGSIDNNSNEIAGAANELSRRTETQAANLEETAAALEQITSTVRTTAEGTRHAHEAVVTATNDAKRSGDVVAKALTAMEQIEQSSRSISNIINVIDEIAFQTNLLALNAGVEAARAGDAGRGFAVVASEVRALAQRAAGAAREIKTLITTSTEHVNEGVEMVGQAADALKNIAQQVQAVNSVITNIASGTAEQASGLDEINKAVGQLDTMTQQNAAMVEEATAATQSLGQQTRSLQQLIGQFKTRADNEMPVRYAA